LGNSGLDFGGLNSLFVKFVDLNMEFFFSIHNLFAETKHAN